MAAKLSWTRRVSTSTTAPSAPRVSSSHMNQNRDCPGVPNRYSTRSAPKVIRPKSMATVVVVLPGTVAMLSTVSPAEVISASVVSGVISEMAPTSVVLPTPNPPATTILADVIRLLARPRCWSKSVKSNENPFEDVDAVGDVAAFRHVVENEHVRADHVGDQDAHHAQREAEVRGDLGQRLRAVATQVDDAALVAVGVLGRVLPALAGLQQRLDRDVAGRLGATAGHRVRTDEPAAWIVGLSHPGTPPLRPRSSLLSRWQLPFGSGGDRLAPGRRQCLADPVHEQCHLVADMAEVTVARHQDRQRRAVADGHRDERTPLHVHDGLLDIATLEVAAHPDGQAHQARGDRGELVGPVGRKVVGRGDQQSVDGHHDDVRDPVDLLGEAVEQPVHALYATRPAHAIASLI